MAVAPLNQLGRIPGYPVSKQTAENIFCGLGEENWWKQLYDGKYHHLGSKVFDKGLHGFQTEPGFYSSALKAFQYAKAHLKEEPNLEFYKELHKIACSHFDGEKTRTGMKASETGQFRNDKDARIRCRFKFIDLLDAVERKSSIKDPRRRKIIQDYEELRIIYKEKAVEISTTTEEAKGIEKIIQKQLEDVRENLAVWNQDPLLKLIAPTVSIEQERFVLRYNCPNSEFPFEKVISSLFSKFNQKIKNIDDQILSTRDDEREKISALARKKLVAIGKLYYALEWGHPYPDGQGRTDLLLLAKLLSENGFTPAILEEPYMSSFSSARDWIAYLEEGMQKWQNEALGTFSGVESVKHDTDLFEVLLSLSQDLKILDPVNFNAQNII